MCAKISLKEECKRNQLLHQIRVVNFIGKQQTTGYPFFFLIKAYLISINHVIM